MDYSRRHGASSDASNIADNQERQFEIGSFSIDLELGGHRHGSFVEMLLHESPDRSTDNIRTDSYPLNQSTINLSTLLHEPGNPSTEPWLSLSMPGSNLEGSRNSVNEESNQIPSEFGNNNIDLHMTSDQVPNRGARSYLNHLVDNSLLDTSQPREMRDMEFGCWRCRGVQFELAPNPPLLVSLTLEESHLFVHKLITKGIDELKNDEEGPFIAPGEFLKLSHTPTRDVLWAPDAIINKSQDCLRNILKRSLAVNNQCYCRVCRRHFPYQLFEPHDGATSSDDDDDDDTDMDFDPEDGIEINFVGSEDGTQLEDAVSLHEANNVDDIGFEEMLTLQEEIDLDDVGVPEELINKALTIQQFQPSSTTSSSSATSKCDICWDGYMAEQEIGTMKCGHGFHNECIRMWLERKSTCPICRKHALA